MSSRSASTGPARLPATLRGTTGVGEPLRVLLVEDNPSDALVIRTLLTGGGSRSVDIAHTVWLRDALALLASEPFDVVLLDVFLPDARNLEALEQVRRRAPDVPVVVLTARDDEHVAIQAVRAGAQEYLCKGRIDADVLLRSLRHAIERHRLLARLEVALSRRKEAEATLQRREEHFRALIENASDVIAVVEADGTIRYLSPSVERVLGYRPGELAGTDARKLVHPDDLRHLARFFARALRHPGDPPAVEYRARHRDGSWRTLHSVASNQLANPAVHGLVVNSRDTTDRREAEVDREQALSLLRATLEATADGILVVDHQRRIAGYNQQFARMWRVEPVLRAALSANELQEAVLEQLVDPEGFRARVSALNADPYAEGFDVLEFRDGRVFERYTKPQQIAGATVGRVWSFRDVTERRRLEARGLHAQKLEAVGQLAGGIAHDFNNILMTIKGSTSLILDDIPEAGSFRGELLEISRAADHAAGLTRQLLAFSRRQLLQPEITDLNAVIARMEQMLRRVLGAQVEISSRPHPDLARVRVDPGQMEQVILNLALNARDSMPGGGTLVLRTGNVDAADPRLRGCVAFPTGAVEVEVSDSGLGMDEATRARIFEPFFTTKEPGRGTGLGLSTVDGIVRQSGGDVLVESRPGAGTSFTVLLPRARGEDPAEPAASSADPADARAGGEAAAAESGETILLVEDTDTVRRVARRILERVGYRVLEASGAEEALRLAEAHPDPIHLLLTDVVMPGMNGPALAERLRGLRPETPVVFMSGYSEDSMYVGALGPETPLLHKPFEAALMLKTVRARLDGA